MSRGSSERQDIAAPAGLIIRAARHSDAEGVAALWACPGCWAGTLRMPFENPAAARSLLERLNESNVLFVAELDGTVVGTAGWQRQTRARRQHAATVGMGVHDNHVARGIGTALMTALIDAADNWYGIRRLELQVFADNAAAIRLYRRFGFEIEGTLKEYAFTAGRFVDALFMARLKPL